MVSHTPKKTKRGTCYICGKATKKATARQHKKCRRRLEKSSLAEAATAGGSDFFDGVPESAPAAADTAATVDEKGAEEEGEGGTPTPCAECGADFVFQTSARVIFERKGWLAPTRCSACRAEKKARQRLASKKKTKGLSKLNKYAVAHWPQNGNLLSLPNSK